MIYLLRHGETLWNLDGRLQGQQDSPLTWRGIAQARSLGELLSQEIDRPGDFTLVSSPLGRAWQTAVIVAEALGLDGREIALDDRLKEMDFGDWTGLTAREVEAAHGDDWARYLADRWQVPAAGGESYGDVAARLRPWLAQRSADDKIIAVCHGLLGRVLRGLYADLSPEDTYTMDEPQSALFRLDQGRVERIGG